MKMDENVAKAVEAADEAAAQAPNDSIGVAQWQTIRARLLELEAENERLSGVRDLVIGTVSAALERAGFDSVDDPGEAVDIIRERAEKAEALLREAIPFFDTFPDLLRDGGDELRARITAHLSENGNG